MAWESAYTKDHIDLLLRLKEIVTGFPLVTMPIRSGAGDGVLYGLHTTAASTPSETWTITCTNDLPPATFSVSGSVSGAQGSATVDVLYSNTALSFTITAGSAAYAVGDSFVFSTFVNPLVAETQTWEVKRWLGTGAKVVNYLASSVVDGSGAYNPEKANDHNAATYWGSDTFLGVNSWWQVEFDKPVDIRRFTFGDNPSNNPGYAPKAFNIAYSDNGTSWTVDSSYSGQTAWQMGELRSFNLLGTAGAHKYWRINFTEMNSGTALRIYGLQMFDANNSFDVAYYGDGYDAILRGPGTAGGDNIYVTIRADAYSHFGPNWITAGAVGYSAGLDSLNQPTNSNNGTLNGTTEFLDHNRLALYDAPFKYWITVSGRLIKVAARFQNICELGYLGFPYQYALPIQYPFPCIVAGSLAAIGSGSANTYHWTRTDSGHSLIPFPRNVGDYGATPDVYHSPARMYTPYNEWKQICSRSGETGTWSRANNYSMCVSPASTDEDNENGGFFSLIDVQEDGQVPMFAVSLIDRAHDADYGELDGVKAVAGIHAIESLLTEGGDTWVILNNVFREASGDFFALRLT